MMVDEESLKILQVECHNCTASLGECKHTTVFVMWMHRRSEKPAPTEVSCYWKRGAMSKIGTSVKFIMLFDFGEKEALESDNESEQLLNEIVTNGLRNSSESQLLKYYDTNEGLQDKLVLHQLMLKHVNSNGNNSAENFLKFCKENMQDEFCIKATNE